MADPYHYSRESPDPPGQHTVQCQKCGFRTAGQGQHGALEMFLAAGGTVIRKSGEYADLTCPRCGHKGRITLE